MVQQKKLFIGDVELGSPFVLAPMAGIADSAFRIICKRLGAALVYSEMISAKGLYYNSKNTEELLNFDVTEQPIAYQLFGSEPDIMALAVEKLSCRKNCIIDVNMGCPVPKVVKNGEGSALMRNPVLASKIVKAMVNTERQVSEKLERPPRPITVKCRLGWDEENINVRDFALRMEESGASALTIHARTREQMYSGNADWESIAEVKSILSIPVIGNGDVFTGRDAVEMIEKTKCDFVMIARGAMGNPWIFKSSIEIYDDKQFPKVVSLDEKRGIILDHINLQIEQKGEKRGVQEMRKHLGWYLKGMEGAAALRRRVNKAASIHDLHQIVKVL